MKTTALKLTGIAFIAMATFFASCDKTETDLNTEAQDQNLAAEIFDEINEISDEAFAKSETLKSEDGMRNFRLGEKTVVTRTMTNAMITIVIDYGIVNDTCADGKTRRGKMIITHTGRFWDGNVTSTFTFENFFVNDNQIKGLKTIVGSINDAKQRTGTITDDGEIILADNAGTISWTSTRTRTLIEGSTTRTKEDDIIKVEGNGSGTLADNSTFSFTITEPLIRKNLNGCAVVPVAGVTKLVLSGGTEIIMDYGDGTCDRLVDVTKDGETTTVDMTGKHRRKG